MDDFEYFYQESLNGGRNNRLSGLKDHAGASMYDGADIDNTITSTNYKYDLIGQLLQDEADGIEHIDWYVGSKKIKRIKRSDNNSPELEFKYNPLGQRVLKITKPRVNGVIVTQNQWVYTYYSYEAGGNVSAVYNVSLGGQTAKATLTEQHIYGAGRLGMIQQDRSLYANGTLQPLDDTLYVKHVEGRMYYELTNYLGNVEAVVNDRKMWSGSDYEAVIVNYADYYPFGMLMPKRHQSETSYRYAYNGMEQDPEVKGDGNSYTTEFRQYDPRVGRWLSLDPLMHEFPWMSPYVAFNNNPIYFIDPLGLEGVDPQETTAKDNGNGNVKEIEAVVVTANRSTVIPPKKASLLDRLKTGLQKVGQNLKQTGVTRLVGLVKTAGGVLEAAVGSAMISSGVGAPLGVIIVAHAADVTAAGVRQTVTGKDTKTLTSKGTSAGLQKVGVSQSTADFVGEAADMTVGMLTLSPSAISAVSTKIAAPVGKVVTSSTTKATTATNVGAKAATVAEEVVEGAAKTGLPANVFSSKAPVQVTPGVTKLSGQYIDDLGRVQPWKATYDKFGRLIERTDWNAANKAHGIDAIHHHIYQYLPKTQIKSIDHIPGVGPTTGW